MKLFANLLLAALVGVATSASFPSFAADEPAAMPAAAAPAKPTKPDLVKGEAAYTSKACASCHNADGNSAIAANPKLAQQHPEYLLKQLHEFKAGKRKNAVMQGMAATLNDEEMRNVAYYMAAQKIKPGFAKSKDTVALGEKIYRGGIADRQVPACAGCHSPDGAGIPAQYPRIGGQNTDYLVTQLMAFRDGVRTNSIQMTGVAAKLNDREIKAVSDYIAGLR